MSLQRTQVAVIGAGPAGSAAALTLARSGVDTVLVERAAFPRVKVCGEYLNAAAVRALDELDAGDIADRAHTLSGMRLHVNERCAEFRFAQSAQRAFPRSELDALLLDKARAAGATVVQGTFLEIEDAFKHPRVVIRDASGSERSIATDFIVAADGTRSSVARALGLAEPPRSGRFAAGGHFSVDSGDTWIEMYRAKEGGYLAVNPLGNGLANVMCVLPRPVFRALLPDLDGGLRTFAARASNGRFDLRADRRVGRRVAVGPLSAHVRRPRAGRALFAGDAAAFVDPFTGQGVAFALRTGKAAATALALAIATRSHAPLATYERNTRRLARQRLLVGGAIDTALRYPALTSLLARRLERVPRVADELTALVSGGPGQASTLRVLCAVAGLTR